VQKNHWIISQMEAMYNRISSLVRGVLARYNLRLEWWGRAEIYEQLRAVLPCFGPPHSVVQNRAKLGPRGHDFSRLQLPSLADD
jgi:hypothetical protein